MRSCDWPIAAFARERVVDHAQASGLDVADRDRAGRVRERLLPKPELGGHGALAGDVLGLDHDAADGAVGAAPRRHAPADPAHAAVGRLPAVAVAVQRFTVEPAPMRVAPGRRQIGVDRVVALPVQVVVAAAEVEPPALAVRQVPHVGVEHRHASRHPAHESLQAQKRAGDVLQPDRRQRRLKHAISRTLVRSAHRFKAQMSGGSLATICNVCDVPIMFVAYGCIAGSSPVRALSIRSLAAHARRPGFC